MQVRVRMIWVMAALFLLTTTFFQSFLFKFDISDNLSIIKVLDELVIYGVFLLVFIFRPNVLFSNFKKYGVFILLWVLYLAVGYVSALIYDLSLEPSIYQTIVDVKIVLILLICSSLASANNQIIAAQIFFKFVIMVNIFFAVFQLTLTSIYDSVFDSGIHLGGFYTDTGREFMRISAAFVHPGALGTFSAMCAAYFIGKIYFNNKYDREDCFYAVAATVLLSLTLSRGEIFSFLFGVFSVVVAFGKVKHKLFIFVFLILGGFLFVANFQEFFRLIVLELGFNSSVDTISPRSIFLQNATAIARDNFPFGVGLGYYGGQAALVFSSDIYYQYGFQDFFWFNMGMFLTDTYWPKIIGETGILGAVLNFFALLTLAFIFAKDKSSALRWYLVFGTTFMLLNSASSAVFNDSMYLVMAFIMMGRDVSRQM